MGSNNMLESFISRQFVTKDDLISFIGELSRLYDGSFVSTSSASLASPYMLSSRLSSILMQINVSSSDREAVLALKSELQEFVEKYNFINIRVPFSVSDVFLTRLKAILKTKLNTDIILNPITDKELISGIFIEYKGNYLDFSFKTFISNYFKDKHDALLSSF